MKAFALLLFTACIALCEDTWESTDGKTITADFLRLQNDSLSLIANGKQYNVPLAQLSKKSQEYARFKQDKMATWAEENLAAPIIAESVLREIIAFDAKLTEGKRFLMEGKIKNISKTSTLGASPMTTAVIELEAGTKVDLNLAGEVDGRMTRIKIEPGKVILTKAKNYSDGRWKDFQDSKILLENGQASIFHTNVVKNEISLTKLANENDINEATTVKVEKPKEQTAEEKAAIGRLRIRAEYLESQITQNEEGGKGVLDGPKYSKEEIEEMTKELEELKKKIPELDPDAEQHGRRR